MTPATAPPCAGTETECGKAAFEAGIQAFRAEDYLVALGRFRTAQQLRPHPVVLYNLALAEAEVGQVVEAAVHLAEVEKDPSTPDRLRVEVARLRPEIERRIATIAIDDPAAKLRVDDQEIEGAPAVARVNPGLHRIQVELVSGLVSEHEVTVGSGERLRVAVTARVVDIERMPAVAQPSPRPPAPSPDPGRDGPGRPVVLLAGGVTIVLGGLAVASGLDTRAAFHDYQRDAYRLTDDQARERVDQGAAKERRTNLLIGATAAAALGTAGLAVLSVRGGAWSGGLSVHAAPGSLVLGAAF